MNERFKIEGYLGQGTYGKVYFGEDLEDGVPICIKINNNRKINKFEYNVLKELNDAGFKNFPQVYGHGKI